MIQLNIKVNVIRTTKTAGALGGWTEVENVLHHNLPCRINWKRGSEKIYTDKNTYFRDAKLFCKVVDIGVKDQIEYNGKTYEVVDVSDIDEKGSYMTLDLKLIQ